MLLTLSAVALGIWLWLWLGWGGFWRVEKPSAPPVEGPWPAVAVIIPARNEAEVLPTTLPSVLALDYPGEIHVLLVDDGSDDGTGEIARRIARGLGREERLTVLRGETLPAGWTGKLWALEQGVRARAKQRDEFLLFTDADIAYPPEKLRRLVACARHDDLDLVSLMVRLRAESFWERLLIPAFVYFFALLYPFSRVNDLRSRTAAAAGGCLLLRRAALEAAGGLEALRGELIDDCALARRIKDRGRPGGGRLRLGLGERTRSLRAYGTLGEIWTMVARTAFVQLRFSLPLLAGTVAGMLLVFLVPPAAALVGTASLLREASAPAAWAGAALGFGAWGLMTRTYLPMVRYYRVSPWTAPLLPVTALLYTLMTIDSARRFLLGRGGPWKGRTFGGEVPRNPEVEAGRRLTGNGG